MHFSLSFSGLAAFSELDEDFTDEGLSALQKLPDTLEKLITYYEDTISQHNTAQQKDTEEAKKLAKQFKKENGSCFTANVFLALERDAQRSEEILRDAKKLISELAPLVDPENYPLPPIDPSLENMGPG